MATTNYSWILPTVGGSEDTWGDTLNTLWTGLDTLLGGVNATEFSILDGATVTTAELNILDGVTATTAELNKLDGVTVSTADINYLDGVTSGIQGQLDGKISGVTAGTGLSGGGTSGGVTLNGVTQSTATWETGTSTTEGIVSPAKVKAAITSLAESPVKAWVNFDGTGTVSIRESFNVSSITDNGTGDYTVNFATALVDANYVVAGSSSAAIDPNEAGNIGVRESDIFTSSAVQVKNSNFSGGGYDGSNVMIAVFR